eukprot:g4439.t1
MEACSWIAKLDRGTLSKDDANALRDWLRASDKHPAALATQLEEWSDMDVLSELSRLDLNYQHPSLLSRFTDFWRVSRYPERTVILHSGEAFFDVAPELDRPFVVYADDTAIRAVGTAFAVHKDGDIISVSVTEGTVELVSGNITTRIAANDQQNGVSSDFGNVAIHANDKTSVSTQPADALARRLGWQDGMLEFRGEPLGQVIAELNRYTDAKIVIVDDDIKDIRLGGYFKVGDIEVITAIAGSFDTEESIVVQKGDDQLRLEEIIVTGRKREESLQEVPIAMSVLGENLLHDSGINDQRSFFALVPGIHYDQGNDRNQALPSIRGVYGTGVIRCDWTQDEQPEGQTDRRVKLIEAGVTDPNILFIAEAQSLPFEKIASYDSRDRVSLQLDWRLDSGNSLQFSAFVGDEDLVRGSDGNRDGETPLNVQRDPNPAAEFPYVVTFEGTDEIAGEPILDPIRSFITQIEENYLEVRWLSPEENRLRYLMGASRYEYDHKTAVYSDGYGAILMGPSAVQRYFDLTGDDVTIPVELRGEKTTNQGNYVDFEADTFLYFDEEVITNLEIGAKGSALDGRLNYSTALFKVNWEDRAQRVSLYWGAPENAEEPLEFTSAKTLLNEGSLDIWGLEAEATYLFNNSWSIRGTFAFLDAAYGDFCSVELIGSLLDTDPALYETAEESGRNYDCYNLNGNQVAEQPEIMASLSPEFKADLGVKGLALVARSDFIYEGREYVDAANVQIQKAVPLLNLSVGVRADTWSAIVYVNNLMDNDTPLFIGSDLDRSISLDFDPDNLTAFQQAILDGGGSPAEFNSNYSIDPRREREVGLRFSYDF